MEDISKESLENKECNHKEIIDCENKVKNKNIDSIIIYNDTIYLIDNKGWVFDYFTYKTHDDSDQIIYYSDFVIYHETQKINLIKGKFKGDIIEYAHFMAKKQDITHLSEEEIKILHIELLKKRIIKHTLDHPSYEEICDREQNHRHNINKFISTTILTISENLYKAAQIGKKGIILAFPITKCIVTNGKSPFLSHPCGDKSVRNNFEDYFNYLMLDIIGPQPSDLLDIRISITEYLIKKIQTIYNHLEISEYAYTNLLPSIMIHVNTNTSNWICE